MRLSEFSQPLTERISLSKHKDEVEEAIKQGILNTLGFLEQEAKLSPSRQNEEFKELSKIGTDSFFTEAGPILEKFINLKLKSILAFELSNITKSIVGIRVPIHFLSQRSLGTAHSNPTYVTITNNYTQVISESMTDFILNGWSDNWDGDPDAMKTLVRVLSSYKDDKYHTERLIDNTRKVTDELAQTVLHELTHAVQDEKQKQKDRYGPQYRSYTQKSPAHFNKAYDERTPEWYKLYITSPQEIGAVVHDIAVGLINDYFRDPVDRAEDLPKIESNTFYSEVLDKVSGFLGGSPKTPKEKMVFKKYMKGVYQEVTDYRDQLVAKLRKREEEERKREEEYSRELAESKKSQRY